MFDYVRFSLIGFDYVRLSSKNVNFTQAKSPLKLLALFKAYVLHRQTLFQSFLSAVDAYFMLLSNQNHKLSNIIEHYPDLECSISSIVFDNLIPIVRLRSIMFD